MNWLYKIFNFNKKENEQLKEEKKELEDKIKQLEYDNNRIQILLDVHLNNISKVKEDIEDDIDRILTIKNKIKLNTITPSTSVNEIDSWIQCFRSTIDKIFSNDDYLNYKSDTNKKGK